MFNVKFIDYTDGNSLAHETSDIIDIVFSPAELESEVPLTRTAQSATISLVSDAWIKTNITDMPRGAISDRAIAKYKVEIYWLGSLQATHFIIFNNINIRVDSNNATITTYDVTRILEVYQDLQYEELTPTTRINVPDILTEYLQEISSNLGLNIATSFEAPNFQTEPNKRIATIDFNPDNELFSDTERRPFTTRDIDYVKTNYQRVVALGFPKLQGQQYPKLRMLYVFYVLELHKDAEATANGWNYRPRVAAKMRVVDYVFYNITAPHKVLDVTHTARFANFSPNITIINNEFAIRPFSRNTRFGLDDDFELSEEWESFIRLHNAYISEMTGDVGVRGYFLNPSFESGYSLPGPIGGTYRVSPITDYSNVRITRPNGFNIPVAFNVKPGYTRYLDLIKETTYMSGLAMKTSPAGAINIIRRNIEPDLVGAIAIGNDNIESLTATIKGKLLSSAKPILNLLGDVGWLTQEVFNAYKGFATRKQIALSIVDSDNVGDPLNLLKPVAVQNKYFGYISSVATNYISKRKEIIVNIVERASARFVVTDGTVMIPNAGCFIEVESNVWLGGRTNASGVVIVGNLEIGKLYNYKINRRGFAEVTGTINVVDEIEYLVERTLLATLPDNPDTETNSIEVGYPVEVRLQSDDNASIYFTTTGTDPDTGDPSQLYTGSFRLLETKTVKAIAVDAEGNESGVITETVTVTLALPPPKVKRFYDEKTNTILYGFDNIPGIDDPIRYTLDGTTPDANSPVYSEPFEIDSNFDIKNIKAKLFVSASGQVEASSESTQIRLEKEVTDTIEAPHNTTVNTYYKLTADTFQYVEALFVFRCDHTAGDAEYSGILSIKKGFIIHYWAKYNQHFVQVKAIDDDTVAGRILYAKTAAFVGGINIAPDKLPITAAVEIISSIPYLKISMSQNLTTDLADAVALTCQTYFENKPVLDITLSNNLTLNVDAGGSVDVAINGAAAINYQTGIHQIPVPRNSEAALEALPDTGFLFEGWERSLTGTVNPETITLRTPEEVLCKFEATVEGDIVDEVADNYTDEIADKYITE